MTTARRERERLAREGEILAAAEKLFFEKGFESTTMDEIARESEFTKRTVYQYFISKEDLFSAVLLKWTERLMDAIRKAVGDGKTGFEKVRLIRDANYRFAKEYPNAFLMMNYAQYIKSNLAVCPHYGKIIGLNKEMFEMFGKMFEAGKQDGSIRQDFNIQLGKFALFFLITGFLDRLSLAGDVYRERFGIDTEELARLAFDMADRMVLPD